MFRPVQQFAILCISESSENLDTRNALIQSKTDNKTYYVFLQPSPDTLEEPHAVIAIRTNNRFNANITIGTPAPFKEINDVDLKDWTVDSIITPILNTLENIFEL